MNNNTDKKFKKVVTRFAPSPTGFVHIGGIRTALYAYLWARKNKGTFILRIEDTDKEREVEGSINQIIESLNWLGLNYDEGPQVGGPQNSYLQSERLDIYKKYAQVLIDRGFAYPDPYTEEDVSLWREQSNIEKKPFLFRDHRPEVFEKWDGTKPLRFKVPEIKRYQWNDVVYGDLSAGPEALDDFILIKSDGYPTYNFAHIVDDIEMGITHVMRGQEFIASMPKFLALYEALSIEPPIFATLPSILAPGGGKKLSKRDGSKDTLEYKKEGYLKESLINFLALLGWNPGTDQEIFTKDELIDIFDLSRIQTSGAQYNEEKLNWINKEHLKKLSTEDQEKYLIDFIPESIKSLPHFTSEMIHKITPVVMDRVSCGLDIEAMSVNGDLDFYFKIPEISLSVLTKESDTETTKMHLKTILELLEGINDWSRDSIKAGIWDYATEKGRGQVLWPMRYALSGKDKSPDPFVLSEIFGKENTLLRIKSAIEILN